MGVQANPQVFESDLIELRITSPISEQSSAIVKEAKATLLARLSEMPSEHGLGVSKTGSLPPVELESAAEGACGAEGPGLVSGHGALDNGDSSGAHASNKTGGKGRLAVLSSYFKAVRTIMGGTQTNAARYLAD
eukprot:scaffold795_cov375-Prasinococcus_capsulatus_cf.AAC.16